MKPNPRIAIACSGLGHVRRGNETWAADLAQALHENGADVTLFGGGRSVEVACRFSPIRNWPREARGIRSLLSWHRRYLLEQLSFAVFLLKRLRKEPFDIVHVPDPALAWQIQRCASDYKHRVIYKDGLLLGPEWCSKFDFVHVLAPYYFEAGTRAGVATKNWFAIPHMVNTKRFVPAIDRKEVRRRLGQEIPDDALVVMAAGDFAPGSNKRLDWILNEFAAANPPGAHLIIAGQSASSEFQRFSEIATSALGDRVHLFTNVNTTQMVELYQAADIFAHAALREPFGIVFLEAMACGLPIAAHQYDVTRWIVGNAGETIDMSAPGQLGDLLRRWQNDVPTRKEIGRRARQRAEEVFSPAQIVPLYQSMYDTILRD
jgi:glycosyltransferase involved in cell wall biosynthesis